MFQSIRPNSPIYILHKGEDPFVEIGAVISQPIVKTKNPATMLFGQPQDLVVDFSAKIGNQTVSFRELPAQLSLADTSSNGESVTLSDSREAINMEMRNQRQKCVDNVESYDYNKQRIGKWDKAITDFNPELAEKQAQKEEISSLKNQVSEMSQNITELMEANRRLIEQLSLKGGQ